MAVFTLNGVNPTIFNFATNVLSTASKSFLLVAISAAYGILLSWHMVKGFKMPIGSMGSIPHSFFAFVKHFLASPEVSAPIAILAVLFACAEFSSTVAILGLDFVNVVEEGQLDTVLTLEYESRNKQRLLQLAGDPLNLRTSVKTGIANPESPDGYDTDYAGRSLERAFLGAVSSIGRGESFLSFEAAFVDIGYIQKKLGGIPMVAYGTKRNFGPLSSIPLWIPLNCTAVSMVEMDQFQGGLEFFDGTFVDEFVVSRASVPNCTFSSGRTSGIHERIEDEYGDKAHVIEHAVSPFWLSVAEEEESDIPDSVQYGLIQNGKTGEMAASFPVFPAFNLERLPYPLRHPFWLVLESFQTLPEYKCSTAVVPGPTVCEQFPEDIEGAYGYAANGQTSPCDVAISNILWGGNFVADAELAAVVAGVLGILKPDLTFGNSEEWYAKIRNSIPAALFAISSIRELSSNHVVVAPQVDGIYFSFMVLPLILATILLVVYTIRSYQSESLPLTPYHMLLLGNEKHAAAEIPEIQPDQRFPTNVNNRLVYAVLRQDDGSMKGFLTTRDDPPRALQDPTLKYFAVQFLRSLQSDELRQTWIIDREITQARSDSTLATRDGPQRMEAFLIKMIDNRLEFLDRSERRAWLQSVANEIGQALPLIEQEVHPSTSANPKKKLDASTGSLDSAIGKSQTLDESHTPTTWRSDSMAVATGSEVRRCTKKRQKIRDNPERCIVCSWRKRSVKVTGEKFWNARKGCQGCQVVVCVEHWPSFSHQPSLYRTPSSPSED